MFLPIPFVFPTFSSLLILFALILPTGVVLPGSPLANAPTSAPLHLALIQGPSDPSSDQFDRCLQALRPLLNKDLNRFCMEVYDGECSVNGAYQPMVNYPSMFLCRKSYPNPSPLLFTVF